MPAVIDAPVEAIAAAAAAAAAPATIEVATPTFRDDDTGDDAEKVKRLPDLFSMATDKPLQAFIPDIMASWCNKPQLAAHSYNAPPARPEWLTMLGGVTPWSAVTKQDDIQEEKDKGGNSVFFRMVNGVKEIVKGKSYAGYIWVSTDPIDLLTNRFVVTSCHRLNNLDNYYRAGNFTYLSCPWFAVVAADKEHPLKNLVDACPKHGGEKRYLTADQNRVKMRNHQAISNIVFMRDSKQRPYLYMNMVYDACTDVPWSRRMVKFLYNRCSRLGIGLAVSHYVRDNKYKALRQTDLRTPDFRFLTNKNHCALISGDGTVCYMRPNGNLFISVSSGYANVILEPTVAEGDAFAPLADFTSNGGSIDENVTFRDAVLLSNVAESDCVDLHAGVDGVQPFIVGKSTRDDAKRLIALYALSADAATLRATENIGARFDQEAMKRVIEASNAEQDYAKRPQYLLRIANDKGYIGRVAQLLNTPFCAEEWGKVREATIKKRIKDAQAVIATLEPALPVGAEISLPEPEVAAAVPKRRRAAAAAAVAA